MGTYLLYSKTVEEKKELAERATLNAVGTSVDKFCLPDAEELVLVGQLRDKFKDQLEKRKENGTHYEFVFGDRNMTRITRGNDSDLAMSEKWLARMLETYDRLNLDTFAEQTNKLLDSGKPCSEITYQDYGLKKETREKHIRYACVDKKAANGDMLMYLPATDVDKKGLVELNDADWKNYVEHLYMMTFLNTGMLDRESKEQGKMVKLWWLYDLKDVSLSGMMNKKFDEKFDEVGSKLFECITAEQVRWYCCLNSPWWLTHIWSAVTKVLPPRFTRKIRVCEGDGSGDEVVSKNISQEIIQKCFATRIGWMAGKSGQPSGEVEVKSGSDFEYAMSVTAGQKISWKFSVGKGSADGMMGDSDLRFGGIAWWSEGVDNTEVEEETGGEVVVPQAMIIATDGEVEGEIELSQAGILTLRWDNYHSKMRGKNLKYDVKLE